MPESTVLCEHAVRGFLTQPHFSLHHSNMNKVTIISSHPTTSSWAVPYVLKSYKVPSSHFHTRAPCLWSQPFHIRSPFPQPFCGLLAIHANLGLLRADSQFLSLWMPLFSFPATSDHTVLCVHSSLGDKCIYFPLLNCEVFKSRNQVIFISASPAGCQPL